MILWLSLAGPGQTNEANAASGVIYLPHAVLCIGMTTVNGFGWVGIPRLNAVVDGCGNDEIRF